MMALVLNTSLAYIHTKILSVMIFYVEILYAIMLMINWNDLQSVASNDYSFHAIISAATVYN